MSFEINMQGVGQAPVSPAVEVPTSSLTQPSQMASSVAPTPSSSLKYFFIIGGILLVVGAGFGGWKYMEMKNLLAESLIKNVDTSIVATTTQEVSDIGGMASTSSLVMSGSSTGSISDGQRLTEIVSQSAKTDMTPEEYKQATSFKVTYPSYGVTFVPGQTYTVTWIAGKLAKAPTYQVRLTDSTYQFDTVLGTAEESVGKFSFVVPDMKGKQYEKYKLVFSNTSTTNNTGGESDYFYIKNVSNQNTAVVNTNKISGTTGPTLVFTVNGLKSINVKSGDKLNYVYSSTNADSFSGTKTTSGCLNPSANEATKKYSMSSGNGNGGDVVGDLYLGCTIVNTITAKNLKTLEEVTSSVSVTVK